jgi:hypothetical protein
MTSPDDDAADLLRTARNNAQRLLEQLDADRASLQSDPPPRTGLRPDAMNEGRQVLVAVIAAAQAALIALDSDR